MNTATNMGPIQVAALTYALCIIIAMAVAGIISILCRILAKQTAKPNEKAGLPELKRNNP